MRKITKSMRRALPGFLGGLFGVVLTASIAEYVRLKIQQGGYPNSVEQVLNLKSEEYMKFSVEWRQVLAQVAMEPENYSGQTVKFLSTLTTRQAGLMEAIAAHVLNEEFLVRDNDERSKHPISNLTLQDFLNLEDLGILQTVATGLEMTLSSDVKARFMRAMRTNSHVLSIEHSDPNKTLLLAITTLTDPGKEIVSLLRKPSKLEHLEWLAQHIRDKGFETRLWASWTAPNPTTGEWQAKYPIKLD